MEINTPTREERIAHHKRGIKMVLLPALMGSLAGIISSPYFLSPGNANFSFLILALAIYVQKFIFPQIGIKSSEFGFKDWFFVGFMSLSYWFVIWTIILNGPAPAFGPFF
ncbi:hypothetical protein CUJ83_06355 [Methanocella sp. CWC-04]|uniref:Uncharacterized protein n=1 Tax=Methanooceanicella nereidis TaxID=2052831 RepID=A0AAP2RDJ0_9EURY|nr:hypothetical protein [Methanocella sp. CWC-04]